MIGLDLYHTYHNSYYQTHVLYEVLRVHIPMSSRPRHNCNSSLRYYLLAFTESIHHDKVFALRGITRTCTISDHECTQHCNKICNLSSRVSVCTYMPIADQICQTEEKVIEMIETSNERIKGIS